VHQRDQIEDIDFALHSAEQPAREARKIVNRVLKEIGHP
jgi:hypothetical protein